jgi:hypothetical protein
MGVRVFPNIRLLALVAVVSCYAAVGCDDMCPRTCPAAVLGLGIVVYAGVDGGAGPISGVEATLMGPATVTLSCEPSGNGDPAAMVCFWPLGGPFTEGTYSLVVTAPGFRSRELSATFSLSQGTCCPGARIEPSQVVLDPA